MDTALYKSIPFYMLQLDVNGIMVRGSVSEEFRELCYARRIAVFDRVPYKVLQGVSESCLMEPTIYVNEATEVGDISTESMKCSLRN